MKLNLDYYKKERLYQIGKSEEQIIEYIQNHPKEEYEECIRQEKKDDIILSLSPIRENLLHGYDFPLNASTLEIGGHLGELTGILCDKSQKVTTVEFSKKRAEVIAKRWEEKENLEIVVGDLNDLQPLWEQRQEKFDVITLIGVLEFATEIMDEQNPAQALLEYCKSLLKPEGKLLIATNNRFALKSYVGDRDECTHFTFDSITGYKTKSRTYKLGKCEIETLLKQVELPYYQFYYPLPDYKLPSCFFSDKYLPTSSKINGYFPYYQDDSFVLFSEVDGYDAIVQEDPNMFPFFANSYLIIASKTEFFDDTKYISFNNYRKQEYQLMTKIKENTVEKVHISEISKPHLEQMKKNVQLLEEENIPILDHVQDGKIVNKFVKEKLASQLIGDYRNNPQKILEIVQGYYQKILEYSVPYTEIKGKNIFEKYMPEQVSKEQLEQFHYLPNGYWDMILKNCFIIDGQYVFFDQEWREENVPAEFLLYRSLVNIEKIRDKLEEYQLFEKLQIQEFIEIFQELDNALSTAILDQDMFSFYTKQHPNPVYDADKIVTKMNETLADNLELKKTNENLTTEIIQRDQKIEELQKTIEEIYESKSWKFARKIEGIKNFLKP